MTSCPGRPLHHRSFELVKPHPLLSPEGGKTEVAAAYSGVVRKRTPRLKDVTKRRAEESASGTFTVLRPSRPILLPSLLLLSFMVNYQAILTSHTSIKSIRDGRINQRNTTFTHPHTHTHTHTHIHQVFALHSTSLPQSHEEHV